MIEKTLSEHFDELRILLIRLLAIWGASTAIAFFFVKSLISFLLLPYGEAPVTFLLISPLEGWWTAMFVAMMGGVLIAFPLILYFILLFVLPALYPEEGKRAFSVGGCLIVFSLIGFFLGHYFSTPFLIKTLQETTFVPGVPAYAVREAIHFVVSLDVGAILLMNLIGGLFFAVLKGWIEVERLTGWRRPYILIAFIAGAILTPPDVFSQLLMAVGLIGGYEGVILFGRLMKPFKVKEN